MIERHHMTLPPWEAAAMALIEGAVERGERAPTCDEIADAVGCKAVSTTVNLVQRLERRGLIRVERYQRERRITILATGKGTAEVGNKTPPWRTTPRPKAIPSITVALATQRHTDFGRQLADAARDERLSMQDMILELIWAGWQAREASIQLRGEVG